MLAIDEVRASFPYLSQCTYLNTASAGLSWEGQGAAAAEFFDTDKSRGIDGMHRWRAQADDCRAELASLLRVRAGSVHFVGNTTEALSLVALSMPLGRGDRVVVADDEFPSVALAWTLLESRGVELVRVPIHAEAARCEVLAAAVETGVRVLAVSHVHWRTGTRLDLARLRAACRAHGCWLVVDGAHAVGAVPVDGSKVDAYCAPVFKWLLSGFGLGFVTLSDCLAAELIPALRGYGNEAPSRSILYSHVNYPGIYALRATLAYLGTIGWEAIHERVAMLAGGLCANLRRGGFDVLTPQDLHAGIVSFRHSQSAQVVRSLARESLLVEDRGSVVRVSPHFYNTEEELNRLLVALGRLA